MTFQEKQEALFNQGFEIGSPTSEEFTTTSGGVKQSYSNAWLFQNSFGEVFEVHGAILGKYIECGDAEGELGLPISDEEDDPEVNGGKVSYFENGKITWNVNDWVQVVLNNAIPDTGSGDITSEPEPEISNENSNFENINEDTNANENNQNNTSPTNFLPPPGKYTGHYYFLDGNYIGHINDENQEKNDAIHVLEKNVDINWIEADTRNNVEELVRIEAEGLSQILHINTKAKTNSNSQGLLFSNKQLIDRCCWVAGEGGGCFPRYYAFAMQNGFLGNNSNEDTLYFWLMRENVNGKVVPLDKEKYFNTLSGAKDFNKTRNNATLRTTEQITIVASVLESLLFPTNDPTNGSNQWRGGANQWTEKKVIQGLCKKRWHIFFRLDGKTQPEIITN